MMGKFQIMTALITPFQTNGMIDYDALDRIIEEQLALQADGFIICGTTAETPCLKEHERFDLLRWIIHRVNHRIPLWFGCGTNQTKETVRLVEKVANYDIDGVLLVTPYYNKPSQEGLYAHFATVAQHCTLPIMLYQVPSRCGVQFEADTLCRLFQDYPNIVALKHASNDYDMIAYLHERFPHIALYSGEDKTFYEGMEKGLSGIISVMSNAYLKEMKSYLSAPSAAKQKYLQQLAEMVFLECSPSAIKYICSRLGKCENQLRLPLVPLSKQAQKTIDQFMEDDKSRQLFQ